MSDLPATFVGPHCVIESLHRHCGCANFDSLEQSNCCACLGRYQEHRFYCGFGNLGGGACKHETQTHTLSLFVWLVVFMARKEGERFSVQSAIKRLHCI